MKPNKQYFFGSCNNAAGTWGYRYVFERVISFSSDTYLEVEMLDRIYMIEVLIVWGTSTLFPIVAAWTTLNTLSEWV